MGRNIPGPDAGAGHGAAPVSFCIRRETPGIRRIYFPGGVLMCRKSHLHGWCLAAFGLGLMLGRCLDSWFLCCFGGIGLIVLGFCVMRQR